MKAPVRVLLVLPTYLPETFGGAEQQSRKLSAALSERGADVTILTPCVGKLTPRHESAGAVAIHRLRQPHLPNLGGRHMLSFLIWTLRSAAWIARRGRNYDVVHIVHGRLHAVGPLLGAMLARKPTLIKVGRGGAHFDLAVVRKKKLIGPLCARLVKGLATGFVANSREIVEDLESFGVPPARVHRIPNGVVMPQGETATSRNEAVRRFVYLGRLDSEKALDFMIDGFAELPDEPPARLVLVGEGDCGTALKAQTARHRLDDRVEFAGRVEDVAPQLANADFFVSTSTSEGMSNALLEAMSHSVPPLTSRVSGVADIVEDGVSGLLFAPGDKRAFVERLGEALAMSDGQREAMGHAAAERVRTCYGMDHIADRHLALYAQLVDKCDPTRAHERNP